MKIIKYLLAGASLLLIPAIVFAQGLVPCDGALTCNLCAFGKLIQNVINYTIGLAIPLSAALFAWAGALYMTSGARPAQVTRAKHIFFSVVIGFLVALSAWLIVQTLLKVLVPGYKAWNEFQCTQERRTQGSVSKWLSELVGAVPATSGPGAVGPGQCSAGSIFDPGKGACKNAETGKYEIPSGYKCPTDMPNFDWDNGVCFSQDGTKTGPPVPGGTGGGGTGFGYQTGIDSQAGDASTALNNAISCMAEKVGGQISSISDSQITSGRKTWSQCRSGECAHSANSCHYGGRSCGDQSYAVDLVGDNAALVNAANSCGAGFVLDERNHVHVSVGNCGCDGRSE